MIERSSEALIPILFCGYPRRTAHVRQSLIGSLGSSFRDPSPLTSKTDRSSGHRWVLVLAFTVLGGFGAATDVRAQSSAGATEKTSQPTPTSVTSLAHYVPKERLLFYVDFAGLDARAEAWK